MRAGAANFRSTLGDARGVESAGIMPYTTGNVAENGLSSGGVLRMGFREGPTEYDFRAGVRGKYAQRDAAGNNVVVLAPDVAEISVDSEPVNEALRVLAKLIRQRAVGPAGRSTHSRRPERPS